MAKVLLQNGKKLEYDGNIVYDPESLLTQGEIEQGLGYENKRVWVSLGVYLEATDGNLSPEKILEFGPRRK